MSDAAESIHVFTSVVRPMIQAAEIAIGFPQLNQGAAGQNVYRRKIRSVRGKLNMLTEMPLGVLFEVE